MGASSHLAPGFLCVLTCVTCCLCSTGVYKLKFETCDEIRLSGTESNVTICLHSTTGDEVCQNLTGSGQRFDRGRVDNITLNATQDLGPVCRVGLSVSGNQKWRLRQGIWGNGAMAAMGFHRKVTVYRFLLLSLIPAPESQLIYLYLRQLCELDEVCVQEGKACPCKRDLSRPIGQDGVRPSKESEDEQCRPSWMCGAGTVFVIVGCLSGFLAVILIALGIFCYTKKHHRSTANPDIHIRMPSTMPRQNSYRYVIPTTVRSTLTPTSQNCSLAAGVSEGPSGMDPTRPRHEQAFPVNMMTSR